MHINIGRCFENKISGKLCDFALWMKFLISKYLHVNYFVPKRLKNQNDFVHSCGVRQSKDENTKKNSN
jgi:hypothetical protein